jgi:hypothetical protein
VVSDADQLRPALAPWLAAHPDDAAKIAAATGAAQDRLVVETALAAIPDTVAAMEKGWTRLDGHPRMTWLVFTLSVAPGATRSVQVAYTHVAAQDFAARVSTTYSYEYLLSPAKTWAGFGPLHLTVRLPASTWAEASIPWRFERSAYRADLERLPETELTIELMSKEGLWLGMTTPGGYWAITILLIGIVSVAMGRAVRRVRTRLPTPSALVRVGWFVATAASATVACVAACLVVGALFPPRAYGFGYGPVFGLTFASLLAGACAAIVGGLRRS